jgi:GrpB-like predicted nucleotidyltransferase (UPF0157 family)
MGKELRDMTLEELWQLFPIKLESHNNNWLNWFNEEKTNIFNIIGEDYVYRLSHIGSTAIKDILAKPIIDILLEVDDKCFCVVAKRIKASEWICMCEDSSKISFNKGYSAEGFAEKVFHLHLRKTGDCDELYFRDYLNANSNVSKQYEKLKLSLSNKFKYNRDAYTAAKTDFITKYTQIAKQLYCGRY